VAAGAGVVLALSLPGCAQPDEDDLFDGQYFSTRARSESRADPERFTVLVRGVSASPKGAREAGHYQGVRYCLRHYGTSDIDWVVGPQHPPEQLQAGHDTFQLQGRCRI